MAKAKKASSNQNSISVQDPIQTQTTDLNIKQVEFSSRHYINEDSEKSQIYLHHTAGNDNALGVFQEWARTNERIATCVVIDSKGLIHQGFSSRKWAYHLGVSERIFNVNGLRYLNLDKSSIGIELCNWGFLTKIETEDGERFVNYVGREVPKKDVIELDKPYKGYTYWHSYTDAQIESVRKLLLLWKERYGIPLTYSDDIWSVSKRALLGAKGVFTHNSVRRDKTDVYPHPKLIEMLKSLNA